MAALIAALLVVLPFAAYLAWLRYGDPGPGQPRPLVLALIGLVVACGVAAAAWYGFSRSMERDTVYVPARLGEDGSIEPGRTEHRP